MDGVLSSTGREKPIGALSRRILMKTALTALLSLVLATTLQAAFAMGPDPGGHTGATVTPETTKTDRPAVDSARESTSGSRTETNAASAAEKEKQARKK